MNNMQTPEETRTPAAPAAKRKRVKCVVWDLDNTLWQGTLLENDAVCLRPGVEEMVRALDERGILQSIASRNHPETALAKLREMGLEEYFLFPQINWGSKAASIRAITEALNIGVDSICFIDDEPFELSEVQSLLPEVLCVDQKHTPGLLQMPEFLAQTVTPESRMRRHMYLSDIQRRKIEEEFAGPHEEFLATLGMVFTISRAAPEDLARAEELTNRTNQLNTTGYTFSYEELEELRCSPNHLLLIAELSDKFGGYGKIGLALVKMAPQSWTIKLLLMSCRVMSRNVGTVMLNHILGRAQQSGVRLLSEFVANDRNRMMYVTYKFAGFKEVENRGAVQILEHPLKSIPPKPHFVTLKVLD
jgi:FkbH-like protein